MNARLSSRQPGIHITYLYVLLQSFLSDVLTWQIELRDQGI